MAWPPIVPPNNRLNTTPTVDNHPSDHNLIADAVTDIANLLGTDPAGSYVDLEDRLDALEQELRPPGELMHFGGVGPPAGKWLATIGGEYPRGAPYNRLFSAVGTLWGAGNGTNTFNVPNLRGRTLFAAGGTTVLANVGVQNYGFKNSSVPQHQHADTLAAPTHTHPMPHQHAYSNAAGASGSGLQLGQGFKGTAASTDDPSKDNTGTPSATALTGTVGNISGATAAAADSNLPPGANCTIWIRY